MSSFCPKDLFVHELNFPFYFIRISSHMRLHKQTEPVEMKEVTEGTGNVAQIF